METFFSLPGGNVDDANNDAAKNSSRRLDGAFLRASLKEAEKKKCAYIVRGINATSFEIIRVVAPASSIGGQCRKKNVSRVTMRPKAFVSCGGDGDRKETFLQCAINKDGDAIAATDGFTLVTYHRVSTRMDGDEEDAEKECGFSSSEDESEDEPHPDDAWVETESIALERDKNGNWGTVSDIAWNKRCDEIAIAYASFLTTSQRCIVRVEHIWNEDEQKSLRVGRKSDLTYDVLKDDQYATKLRCGDTVIASSSAETVFVYFGTACARIAHPKGSIVLDFLVLEDDEAVDEEKNISRSRALIATLASDDCVRFWNVRCTTNGDEADGDNNSELVSSKTTSSLKVCVTNDESTSGGKNAFVSFDVHENFLLTVDASGFATAWLLSNIRGDINNRIAKATRVRRRFSMFGAPFYNQIPVSVMAKCTLIESQNRVAVEAIAYDSERIERSYGTSTSSVSTSISSGHSHALKKIDSNTKADKIGTLDVSGKLKFWLSSGNASWTSLGGTIENIESFAWSNLDENVVYLLRRSNSSVDEDGALARIAFTDENVSEMISISLPSHASSTFWNYDSLNVLSDDDVLILTPRISGNVKVCSIKARQGGNDTTLYECKEMSIASKTPRGTFDVVKSTVSGPIIACFDGNTRTNFWRFDAEVQIFDLLGYVSSSKNVVSLSTCGSRACVVDVSGDSIELLDASGELDGKLTSVATFPCDSFERSGTPTSEWLDIGGGSLACLVAVNQKVFVLAPNSKLGEWTVAYSRAFEKPIARAAWKSNGSSIIVSFDDGEILSLGVQGHESLARKIAEISAPLPCYHPAVLHDWIVRRKAHRARAAIRKVVSHLENVNNIDMPTDLTSSARSTISSILELENSNADDRPSTPRGKVISPRGASKVSAFSSAPTPSLVPEFDLSAFGGFGGGSNSSTFTTNKTSPNMFAPENLSRQNSLASESTSLFRQNSNSLDDSASTTTTYTSTATAPGSSVSFSATEAEIAADVFSRHADYLGLSSQEAIEVLGCLDALRDSDVGIEATVDQAGRRLHALHRVRELTFGRQRGTDNADVDVTGEGLLWAAHCETGDAVIDAILHTSSSSQIAWRDLRMLGVPIWLRNETTLKTILDKAARASFAKTKDPESCALLFVCLGRTSVLAGLYKAKRDQKLFEFLSRDFNEKRHQEAALKNAYALLSKHRYELSATFFALAGQYEDAAKICLKHVNDVSLSIAILRCATGPSSSSVIGKDGSYSVESEVSKFIRKEILEDKNDAIDSFDTKWRLAAFYWMSGDCVKSVAMLSRLVGGGETFTNADTKKESHALKASALDLLTHIASRRRKVVDPRVLVACEKAVKTKSASVSRAFELAGMPLAALERLTNSRGKRDGHENSLGLKSIIDNEDDVPEFEQVGGLSPLKQKDSIDHAMELASTVVENFGLNDVVSPLRRSVSQLVNTGQFDFDGAFGWKLDHNATTTSTPTTAAERIDVPTTPANDEALTQKGSLYLPIEQSNADEEGTSVQHLNALKQKGVQFVTKSAAARLAASALLVAFDESGSYVAKYSDVPDDAQACTEMLSRAPFDVDASMLQQSLSRRALTLRRYEDNLNSNANRKFSSATANDGLAEFFRSSVKRKIASAAALHIQTSSTKRAVSKKSDRDASMPVLKKSVELARLSGDGFVDLCCNARETTELAVAAVRRGLVTVDLKELSKSGDSKRAPGVLSAAEAMRRATAESKASEPTRSLMELFGFSKKQNLWAEASVSLEDWNMSFAPKYSKRKNRMTSSSNAANVADREPSSPDAHRRPETPSSAPKTPHLHDWGHELGVVIPAAAALSRQDSQSSPGSSPRFSLAGGKESESPADVSARVVVSHPSFPIFACGSANRGLQIWRFGFEETKKRFQLESSKDSTSNGSNSHSTSSSSPVALSFNAYGERLACATTDGRVALYDSSSSLRTMASRLCVFDSNSNSSAFVAAKPKEVAFVSTLVCAIACESKGYSNGVTGGMMRSEKALADGNGILLWDAAQPNSSRCGVLYDTCGVTSVLDCAVNGPSLLASGNRNGEVVVHDLRKLSSSTSATSTSTTALWRSAANSTKITSLLHHNTFSSSSPTSERQILLSGDDKGDLRVYSFSDGRLLQSAEKAHDKHAFMAPRIGGASVAVGLSSMCKLDKGVLTAGGDGAVKLFRFS